MLYDITLNKGKLNDYQLGRINGMIHILTGQPEQGYALKEYESRNVCVMTFDTDKETMLKIQEAIEKSYPGVIVPDEG